MNSDARLGAHAVEQTIVTVKFDAAGADALAARKLGATELGDVVGLVGRRVPLLVGHDDEDVRPRRHQALTRDARRCDEDDRTPVVGHRRGRTRPNRRANRRRRGRRRATARERLRRHSLHLVVRSADARGPVDRSPLPTAPKDHGRVAGAAEDGRACVRRRATKPIVGSPVTGWSRIPAFTSDACTDPSGRVVAITASQCSAAPRRPTAARSAAMAASSRVRTKWLRGGVPSAPPGPCGPGRPRSRPAGLRGDAARDRLRSN